MAISLNPEKVAEFNDSLLAAKRNALSLLCEVVDGDLAPPEPKTKVSTRPPLNRDHLPPGKLIWLQEGVPLPAEVMAHIGDPHVRERRLAAFHIMRTPFISPDGRTSSLRPRGDANPAPRSPAADESPSPSASHEPLSEPQPDPVPTADPASLPPSSEISSLESDVPVPEPETPSAVEPAETGNQARARIHHAPEDRDVPHTEFGNPKSEVSARPLHAQCHPSVCSVPLCETDSSPRAPT